MKGNSAPRKLKQMKKILNFLVMGVLILMTSCGTATKTTTRSSTNKLQKESILLTEESLKTFFGQNYYNDAFIKKLHVSNSSRVIFTLDQSKITTETEITPEGGIKQHEDKVLFSAFAILPANTPGRIDSIVRYDTKNIWKYKVQYVIKGVGPCYIWYYRKSNTNDNNHWYASNNSGKTTIEGVSLDRTTLDNFLKVDFSKTNEVKTVSKAYEIISPFIVDSIKVIKKTEENIEEE